MAKLKMKTISIKDLVEYEKNPRRNDKAVDAVRESIAQFGYINPIIVTDKNLILAGHTRLKAIKNLGTIDKVDVIVVSGMSEAEEKAFRIADNRTAEFSEWDENMLTAEMKAAGDIDWSKFGFKGKELKALEPAEKCVCPKCGAEWFKTKREN